ncbi:MAG: hypothetical protein CO149_06555 [Nitrospirae bacterium CG_4_9_14_3_um_filter_51_5]|nr:MAG: hypothetical protein CO149_06555 [Nitrospirae bacterium CG_4_9_14_3_um_filter_51_5]
MLFITFSVLISVAGTGCSKKLPKYPEDHARFQRVVQAIKTLETAYVNQDASAFQDLLLPLENLDLLEANVREDFATFSTIQLNLIIDRMVIDGDRISAFVSWQGNWQRTHQGPSAQASGHGVLLWSGNQVILLRRTEGDLPFGITHRLNFSS